MSDVFISHSKDDAAVAEELKDLFEKEGLMAYVAYRDVGPGESWVSEIRQNLINSKEVVVVISSNSKGNLWIAAECGAAWALSKKITPALVGMKIEDSGVVQFIESHQAVEISTENKKRSLVSAVASRLKSKVAV